MELKPGQLWWDKDHKWCNGSNNIDVCYLILSADRGIGNPPAIRSNNDPLYYRCAFFMWSSGGYHGAHARYFLEEEVKLMEYVGSITDIKSFNDKEDRDAKNK